MTVTVKLKLTPSQVQVVARALRREIEAKPDPHALSALSSLRAAINALDRATSATLAAIEDEAIAIADAEDAKRLKEIEDAEYDRRMKEVERSVRARMVNLSPVSQRWVEARAEALMEDGCEPDGAWDRAWQEHEEGRYDEAADLAALDEWRLWTP